MQLTFTSRLHAARDDVWAWITSVEGIGHELWPMLKMTTPRGLQRLDDVDITPGKRLFRSWVLLFGVIPVDRSDLTLIELEEGRGFVEESPLLSMRRWRHERRLAGDDRQTTITDTLTFEPRFGNALGTWFIRTVFRHRHAVLRRHFGSA